MIHTELILTGKPVSSSYQNLLQFSGSGVTSTLVKADGNDFDYTASVSITSSYSVSSSWAPGSATYTSSLFGTASWAVNALTASYAVTTSFVHVETESSSFASSSISSSYAFTASFALNSGGGTGVVAGGSYNISASWASSSLSASYVSESVMGKSVYQIQYITSASYAALSPPVATTVYIIKDLVSTITIVSASWAETASFALNGGTVGSFMNSNNPTFTGTMTQNTGGAFEIDIAGNIKTAGTIIATGSITSLGGFVGTASWATNALTASVMAPSLPYVTIVTSSANWITCSFLDTDEYVNIATGSVTYNFTCSNLPASSKTSNLTLFLNNTITGTNTASLSFPANWSFVGLAPTYITASKHAVLNLKAWGTSNIAAAWNPQY